MERMGRRDFNKRLLATVTALALSSFLATDSTPKVEWFLDETDPRGKLFEVVNSLPDTTIKGLLIARVLPYYQISPPDTIRRGTEDFRLIKPTITMKVPPFNIPFLPLSATAMFTERDPNQTLTEQLFPLQHGTTHIPIPGFVPDKADIQIPDQITFAPDGTPLIEVNFPLDKPVLSYLSPTITIYRPNVRYFDKDFKNMVLQVSDFSFVKEACTALIDDMQLEIASEMMGSLSLPTRLPLRKRNGEIVESEIITQALYSLNGFHNRYLAAVDLAGYILAFKSIQGTIMELVLAKNNPTYFAAIQEVYKTNLGANAATMLRRSFELAITSPPIQSLRHNGDIHKLN